MRAEVGATLPHSDPCNWRATFGARQPRSLVHPKIILEVTAPINPIDAGTTPRDAILQHGADTLKQPSSLLLGKTGKFYTQLSKM